MYSTLNYGKQNIKILMVLYYRILKSIGVPNINVKDVKQIKIPFKANIKCLINIV